MYKIKYMPPICMIYNEVNDFVVQCNCIENAELIKRLLNFDLIFKKPYVPLNKFSKNSRIYFEKLVDNKK